MAKTSPRKPTFALLTKSELANSPEAGSRPALWSAEREAGITPALAAMATKLRRPPSATTHMKRRCRFRTMHAAARK